MPQNEHKYLALPSVNLFESLYSSRQRLYLSNSIFSKNSIEQMFLNVKKYHFLTLKKICSIEFLENKELRVKLISSPVQIKKKISLKETRQIAEKRGKVQKSNIFWTRCCHGNDLQKVKQHKYDCENVTNLAEELREHKSQGEKTRLP